MDIYEKLEYADQTILNPIGLLFLLVMCALTFTLKRSHALIPMILLTCFITPAQRITLFGFDFTLLRLLAICGAMRVISRGEVRGVRLGTLDRVFFAHVLVSAVVYTVLHGTSAALVHRLGLTFDALGVYCVVRVMIRSWDDLDDTIGGFVLAACIAAIPFAIERFGAEHRNIFSIFGGISEFSSAREGNVRAHGAFPHAVIAGCYFVGITPLILARFWTRPMARVFTVAALGGALMIVYATASSTPVAGLMIALAAGAFFPFRNLMAQVRWGAALGLVFMQMLMTNPIWHLISRIDLVGGSTGWHRYFLIDQCVRRVSEWWLMGTRSTAHWGLGLTDLTNQYVLEAVRGGLLGVILFVTMLALALRGVGRMIKVTEGNRPRAILSWMLGVAIFAHMVMFMAVSYFGQIYSLWFFTLAVVASLEQRSLEVAAARARGIRAQTWKPPTAAVGVGAAT